MKIKIVGPVPEYKTNGSAGADLMACIKWPITIKAGERALIPTGIKMEIPEGYEAQIRPRSGLSYKSGITVILGTIDSDYRGDIGVILHNISNQDYTIHNGDRIAQMVIAPVVHADFESVETLEETDRGENGFGSTGIN